MQARVAQVLAPPRALARPGRLAPGDCAPGPKMIGSDVPDVEVDGRDHERQGPRPLALWTVPSPIEAEAAVGTRLPTEFAPSTLLRSPAGLPFRSPSSSRPAIT